MNNSVNTPRTSASPVKAFDPAFDENDNREMIFAWDNDKLMLRPNSMKCPTCNHALPGLDADAPYNPNTPNCKNMRCENCGHSVKLYGHNDLSYDRTLDDADYDDADEFNTDREQPNNVFTARTVKKNSKAILNPKNRHVRFADEHNILGPSTNHDNDFNYDLGYKHDNDMVLNKLEHLNTTTSETNPYVEGVSIYLIITLITFVIALIVFSMRSGDHNNTEGNFNYSMLLCIFFVPYWYLTYAIIDSTTSPKHNCYHS